jgi:hypothetical protein
MSKSRAPPFAVRRAFAAPDAPAAEKRGLSPPFLATKWKALGAGARFRGESDRHPADALDNEIGGEE